MHLCIFHAACKQHLPFHKEKLICVSWSTLRWESSTVLWIWDAETRRGVGVLSSLGRGSISGEWCWLGSSTCVPAVLAASRAPACPSFSYSLKIRRKAAKVLCRQHYVQKKSFEQREKMEMLRTAFSSSVSFGLRH